MPVAEALRNAEPLIKEHKQWCASDRDRCPNGEAAGRIMGARALLTQDNTDIDGALAELSEAIALEPSPAWQAKTYHERGFYRRDMKNDIEGALADFSEAIRLDGNSRLGLTPIYLEDRADIWLRKKAYDKAIADLSAAISISAKTACEGIAPERQVSCRTSGLAMLESHYLAKRGEAWMYKADYPKALADLDRALVVEPNNIEAYVNRARVHASRNDFATALKDADRGIELNPKSFPVYFYRGLIYKQTRQWDKAIADFEKVLEINPGNAGATEQLELARTARARSVR
jgi:tetratricopeptide (TPR) repeat protein